MDKYEIWREQTAHDGWMLRKVLQSITGQVKGALEFYSRIDYCLYKDAQGILQKEEGEKARAALKVLSERVLE